ncbi:MAG: histidine phosphatase family protein [Gemmatimonadota bacterium]
MKAIARTFAVLALLAAPLTAQRAETGPAHIILIRHGEKPADPADPHLAPAGVVRSQALVSFITTDPAMVGLGTPAAIFATRTTKDDNGQRTQETVAPLARALKLPVQVPYLGKDFASLARDILSSPALAGKTVLICWNHEFIPQLVAALGARPPAPKWKGSVFDAVYVITYHKRKPTLEITRYGAR